MPTLRVNPNRPGLSRKGSPLMCSLLHAAPAVTVIAGLGFCEMHVERIFAIQADADRTLYPKARPRRHISFLPTN